MRRCSVLVLLSLLVAGCPEPVDGVSPGGPPTAHPPPGEAGANGEVPQPGPQGDAPPGDAPPEGSIGPAPVPGLASLVKDGKTVIITGTVKGLKEAQIDITAGREEDGKVFPELLEMIHTTDGTFTVTAPAELDRTLYITAMVPPKPGAPPDPEMHAGMAPPFKLEGKDVSIEIDTTKGGDWAKALPWQIGAPTPGGETPPPPDGGPGLAPQPPGGPGVPAAPPDAGQPPPPAGGG